MVIQCPCCGMQRIVPDDLYGKPLFRCGGCGAQYLTDKITEPALGTPARPRSVTQGVLLSLGLLLGVFVLLDGLTALRSCGSDALILVIAGLLFLAGPAAVLAQESRARAGRIAHFREALRQSEERLKDPVYQAALLSANNVTREFRQSLEAFNEAHGIAR
jgi:hypothetical protein